MDLYWGGRYLGGLRQRLGLFVCAEGSPVCAEGSFLAEGSFFAEGSFLAEGSVLCVSQAPQFELFANLIHGLRGRMVMGL